MFLLRSRLVGLFWFLWGLLSFPFAFGVALISSSNMAASDFLPHAALLWVVTGGVQIFCGGRLMYKPKSGSQIDAKLRIISLWGILIAFALQMVTVPIIPW